MNFLINLHHVVYIPVIVLTAVAAMAWSVTFIVRVMEGVARPAPVAAASGGTLAAEMFRPVVIDGGAAGLAATLRAAQMPLRSGVRAAQPYRASFGG